jgi:hypothetical protein
MLRYSENGMHFRHLDRSTYAQESGYPLRRSLFTLLIWSSVAPALAQEPYDGRRIEYSAGTSVLIYQSVYSMDETFALEGCVRGVISGPWGWQAGGRIGLSPARPELFGGLLVVQEIGSWRPSIGLELGVTSRAKFDEGKGLLRETRKAMDESNSPFYFAVQTAPLSFEFSGWWRASLLEVHVGTHLSHIGRTLRVQLGILSVGAHL